VRIAIFGASGATGRVLVDLALTRGLSVNALVRTPGKLTAASENLHIIQGNVAQVDVVSRVLRGCDAVISTLGVGRPLRHDQAVIDGIGHVLRSMEEARIRRLVYLSFTGVPNGRGIATRLIRPIVGFLLRHEVADHQVKESLIRASGIDWTILQAPKLTNGSARGRYRCGPGLASPSIFPTLSRADVADALLAQVADHRFIARTVSVFPD
jgi:putative NADH-flavin reductase